MLSLAKVTSKGQITIPIEIRKKLAIKTGDKLLFIEKNGEISIINTSMSSLINAQEDFKGVAESQAIYCEDDVVKMIKEHRGEKQ